MRRYLVRGWDLRNPNETIELGVYRWRWFARRAARKFMQGSPRRRHAYVRDVLGPIA